MPEQPIPLSSPDIGREEIDAVVAVLQSGRLSLGPRLEAFESACAKASDRAYGIAVNSGTSALHLCIRALNIGDEDEVLTTPFSFIATTNCILFERAKPVLVDIDIDTYNMDPDAIVNAISPRTKALLPVEAFGNTAHFDNYERIARKHGLAMIEDCCEALGGVLCGRKAGSFGDCGTFAFYPNKQITTGEGGMIVTDDEAIRDMCRALRNQGRHPNDSWLQHTYLGYNYRMSDINAAIGEVQVRRLPEILTKRRRVAERYDQTLAALEQAGKIHLPPMAQREEASFFVYVVRLSDDYDQTDRNSIIYGLREAGIGCNAYFVPIHLQPYIMDYLGTKPGDFPITEYVADRTIALPFYANMNETDVDRVCEQFQMLL